MARVNLHFRTALIHLCNGTDILNSQLRIDSLGEHVVGQGQNIHISCTLTVAEQRSLHTLSPCQKRQLRGRHPGTPVIVRVYT